MAHANLIKSTFTSGVLDARLAGRVDIGHYEKGLQTGNNILITPYGSIRRRPGLRWISTLVNPGGVSPRLLPFSYKTREEEYCLVLGENAGAPATGKMFFFLNGAQLTNINGSGNDWLVTPWPVAAAPYVRIAQSQDAAILVHEDYAPQILVRGATSTTWSINPITFKYVPQVDYNDLPAPTSHVQTITFAGGVSGETYKLDLEGVQTETIVWATDVGANNQLANVDRIQKAVAGLYVVAGGDVVVARTGALTYTVTMQNASARVYKVMTYVPVGATLTAGIVISVGGTSRAEDAWSATRGYPRTVCFWESRTVFGGTKSQPQTIYMSVTNDPYNFNLGGGLADDAISRTLNTDSVNKINAIVPAVNLQVFTESSEFFFPTHPLTPENSTIAPQTNYGCSTVQPVKVDGTTAFLDTNGTSLRQFNFDQLQQQYSAPSASRLSSTLFTNPVAMSAQTSNSDDQAAYLYVVTRTSQGKLSVLQTLRTEEIAAWTQWQSPTNVLFSGFYDVCALRDMVYVLMKRGPGAATAWTIEILDEDMLTDGGIQQTGAPSTTWNTPAYLDGVSCRLLSSVPETHVTPVAGVATLSAAVTGVEIGIDFATTIQPMPAAILSQNIAVKNHRARLGDCYLHVRNTRGLNVNGYPMDDLILDASDFDKYSGNVTGVLLFRLAGWGELLAPVITQDGPYPMEILSLEYEVQIN